MPRRRLPVAAIAAVNVFAFAAFAVAAAALSDRGERRMFEATSGRTSAPRVEIGHRLPWSVTPFYDDPSVVSDEGLRDVLFKIRPKFDRDKLSSNYVEHALRAWGATVRFQDPAIMDGPQLVEYMTDYGRQLTSWESEPAAVPLIVERPDGVAINWGKQPGESVHHDHWLACLTEAGVPLDTPIYGPSRRGDTLEDAIQEAARDFDPSERETEWSVMAFGFWLPPETTSWTNRDGRRIDFDLLAGTLMRGDKRFGVCSGTHRVYSLMVLLRLDDRFHLLTPPVREAVLAHMRTVRDLITVAQWEDGRWAGDWSAGAVSRRTNKQAAAEHEEGAGEADYKQVIATGHHLEWLAIAYPELHPNRDVVRKAAAWIVAQVRAVPQEQLMTQYTFYSHVGNALALWRKTHPAAAWGKLSNGEPLEAP